MDRDRDPTIASEPPSDGDDALLDSLLSTARREQPPPGLAEQISRRLEWQSRYLDGDNPNRDLIRLKKTTLVSGLAAMVLAAAGMAFILHRGGASEVPVRSEPASTQPAAVTEPPRRVPPIDHCRNRLVAAGQKGLIDDFEDGDDSVVGVEGRRGLWRWVRDTDATGTAPALLPIPRSPATRGNRLALHVKGQRLLDWGTNVEFSFDPSCYDASAYAGISFEAKGPGRIYLSPRQVDVIPVDNGGACEKDCYNTHVKKFDLDEQWVRYEARWGEATQRGYGKPPVDPSRLHSIAFMIRPEDTPYDVWIDEVTFIPR